MLAELATEEDGVLGRRALLACGLTRHEIEGRVASGHLIVIHRGVYAVGHAALTPRGRARAAVLACGPRAVLSHQSSAALLGFRPEWHGMPHVTAPTSHTHEGIVIHRSRTLDERDVIRRYGIPMTAAARTLLDLAEALPPRQLQTAVNEAEVLRLTTHEELRALLARSPGRRGAKHLGPIVAEAPRFTRSELERDFLSLVGSLGLPHPETNTRIGDKEVDFVWRDRRLVVEVDGFAFHRTRHAFERDRARDAQLTARGWRVVRFTYRQIQDRDDAAKALRAIYDAA